MQKKEDTRMKTRWTKQRMLAGTLGLLIAAPFAAEVASGNPYYYTNADTSNPRLNLLASWSLDPDVVDAVPSLPGSSTDLIFNMNTLNTASVYAHMGGGDRHYNSFTFRSSGETDILRTRIDNPSPTSDSLMIVGSGGITLDAGAGDVNFGGVGQRVFMRLDGSQSIVNNSSSDLEFHWQMRPHTTVAADTTTTLTVEGSGSGDVIFNRLIDNTDRPLALTINSSGSGMTTLGETGADFPHSYTGDTTIQSGLLRIDGTISASDVTVHSGGSVGGAGTIDNDLTFAGGQFDFTLQPNPLHVGGTVSFSSAFGIVNVVANWDSLDLDVPYTLITGTIDTENLQNLGPESAVAVGEAGRSAYFEENSLSMVVIPEPSTLGLIGLGLAIGALARRRFKS